MIMEDARTDRVSLSVCVASWNVREHLERCLRSVAENSGEEAETIVVDNASRDGSAEMVAELFPGVRLIANRRNRGFAAAVNQALAVARGRCLLLLNPDTVVRPGAFREMTDFFARRPGAGAAGCRLLEPDGRVQPSVRSFPTFASALERFTILGRLRLLPGVRRRYLREDFDYRSPAEVDQVMGAALFLRREALEEVGFLDERFFLYFEEVDLCRRLKSAGWEIWYNPRAAVVHYGGASFEQAAGRSRLWLLESQLKYFRKHRRPLPAAVFTALFKPLVLLGEGWGLATAGGELLASRLRPGSRERMMEKEKRWRRKLDFFRFFLPRFILRG